MASTPGGWYPCVVFTLIRRYIVQTQSPTVNASFLRPFMLAPGQLLFDFDEGVAYHDADPLLIRVARAAATVSRRMRAWTSTSFTTGEGGTRKPCADARRGVTWTFFLMAVTLSRATASTDQALALVRRLAEGSFDLKVCRRL